MADGRMSTGFLALVVLCCPTIVNSKGIPWEYGIRGQMEELDPLSQGIADVDVGGVDLASNETICTFQVLRRHVLLGFDDHVLSAVPLHVCASACLHHQDFQCLSFDYFAIFRACFLSSETQHTQNFYFLSDSNWSYYEKICFDNTVLPQDQSYRLFEDKSAPSQEGIAKIFQPATLLQCKLACSQQTQHQYGPSCASFEYNKQTHVCMLRSDVITAEDLVETPGTTYYVPVDVNADEEA